MFMQWINDGNRPIIPNVIPFWYSKLMQQCWHANPAQRPPFAEIVDVLTKELESTKPKPRVRSLGPLTSSSLATLRNSPKLSPILLPTSSRRIFTRLEEEEMSEILSDTASTARHSSRGIAS